MLLKTYPGIVVFNAAGHEIAYPYLKVRLINISTLSHKFLEGDNFLDQVVLCSDQHATLHNAGTVKHLLNEHWTLLI